MCCVFVNVFYVLFFTLKEMHLKKTELQLNKTNVSDAEASYLDLHLSISDGFAKTKTYDKRDDFDFDIVNFPFLCWGCSSFRCLYFSSYSICSSVQSC